MRYVGIDLHKRSMTICVIDSRSGETFARRFGCSQEEKIRAFFEGLGSFEAVVEASATYEWLWLLLEPVAERLVLAHPKRLRIIAESLKKTDRNDAYQLAWLLSQDAVPEAHRPSPRQREYQTLVKHRVSLVESRSQIKTVIRSILAARNLDQRVLFSSKGREYLAEVKLPEAERFRVEELLVLLEFLSERIEAAEAALKTFRKEAPEHEREQHKIVRSVPGVGNLIGDVVLSSLGDVKRFPSEKRITAYSGLIPGLRESDNKRRELGITKEGPRILRWALVEGAWGAVRNSPRWREVFERVARRRGRKKAIVAVARKLLAVIFSLLRRGQSYLEQVAEAKRRRKRAPALAAVKI